MWSIKGSLLLFSLLAPLASLAALLLLREHLLDLNTTLDPTDNLLDRSRLRREEFLGRLNARAESCKRRLFVRLLRVVGVNLSEMLLESLQKFGLLFLLAFNLHNFFLLRGHILVIPAQTYAAA